MAADVTPSGGVADEAAKALSALEGWLRSVSVASSPHVGDGVPDLVHLAGTTGGPNTRTPATCEFCPICQLIAAARHARPDVLEHLADAFGAVMLAFRAVTEPPHTDDATEQPEAPAEQLATAVQRITIT